jgi:MOSC domain-containing protein YiiM/ferredoxin-NADP reductase
VARLASVNVGLPQNVQWSSRTVLTGIWKTPVDGARIVRRLNVDGDGQGDTTGHGGENRAVYVYQLSSYRHWETELHRKDFTMGQFGENFTVDGLADDEVCIGDRYRIGSAIFEVSQPRVTCYRVGVRMNEPRMPALLVSHGRPGFYFRVLQEGEVRAGDAIELVARLRDTLTIADTNAQLYLPNHSAEKIRRATRIPALSSGWRASFEALLEHDDTAPGNAGLAPSDVAPAAWSGFRDARIAYLNHETSSVVSFDLESADGTDFTRPRPGQFVVLKVRVSSEAPAVMRSLSICALPRASRYGLAIKCEPHGLLGQHLRDIARVGDTMQVSAPRGSFVLQAGEEPVVLVSAGIGVTPVLAMLHDLVDSSSQRETWWLYGARNRSEHPFRDEVSALLGRLPGSRSHVWYSSPEAQDVIGRDFDAPGHLSIEVFSALGIKKESSFYLCGPPLLLRDVRAGLLAWGVLGDRIHSEVFGPGSSSTPGIVSANPASPPHPPVGAAGTGPSVSFARSGLATPWSANYLSLLDFAEACDVPVRWSCRTGVCHSCESGLISGDVVYSPDPLDPPALGNVLLCCATPRGDVVLDL